jgi:glycosyltransferase involved in cell wall biosynthesis
MTTVDIVVPVLNEEDTLEKNIDIIVDYIDKLAALGYEARVVIADNGSTDRTEAIGRSLTSRYGNVAYVRLQERGVGRALKLAWGQSTADIVGYMDLDLATDLRHLPEAFEAITQGADIVYGSRLSSKSVVIGRTAKRAVISRVFNGILKVYLGAKFSDGMCGFKFLRRSILAALRDNGADSDGWFFATEVLYVGQRLGFKLFELPVQWTDDPNSKVKVVKLTQEYMAAMRRLRERDYPVVGK